jgi:hypothetical protein
MSTLPLRHVVIFDVGYVKGGAVFCPSRPSALPDTEEPNGSLHPR